MFSSSQLYSWLPEIWRVTGKYVENHDTVTLKIEPQNKEREEKSFSANPGQFNMLYSFGIGEIPISISGISDDFTLFHTIRNVGAVSQALFNSSLDDTVGLRGPFGSSWNLSDCEGYDIIVMAGGVGLAPLKPLIEQLIATRQRFVKVMVFYGARDPNNLIFNRDTHDWKKSIEFLRTVDTIAPSDQLLQWEEHVGVVPDLLSHVAIGSTPVRAFICGPEVMMRFSIIKLMEIGVPPSEIYLSMERNMKCAMGFCGHCQYGGAFICKDGPVFRYDKIAHLLKIKEV